MCAYVRVCILGRYPHKVDKLEQKQVVSAMRQVGPSVVVGGGWRMECMWVGCNEYMYGAERNSSPLERAQ